MVASEKILEVDNLRVSLAGNPDKDIINGITFQLCRNEILCVVGESGSGKSVTASAIMGLLPQGELQVTSGEIIYRGQNLTGLSERDWSNLRGKAFSMIFQEPMTALNPVMKVGTQVDEVLERHTKLSSAERRKRVVQLFEEVLLPDPESLYSAYPFQLSGGQRQRVVIAMALALEPDILIADEPTTALDVTTQAQILALIRKLQERLGIGVVFITHDFGVVAEIADHIVVMNQGIVVEQGSAEQILNNPVALYTQKLIEAVPHKPDNKSSSIKTATFIQLRDLYKEFGKGGNRRITALDNVILDIFKGEILGLVGESGSGKSTLGKVLVGLLSLDKGSIQMNGNELASLSKREFRLHRKQMQMVFQDPYASLNPRHRIVDAIAQGPIAFGMDRRRALKKAQELLELVGLDPAVGSRFPHQFSGGQRQRIGIARALALGPSLLVADEAVSALDVSIQAQVLGLLEKIKKELDLAILFITHDLRVAAQICDRIAVMQHGKIVELGGASNIFYSPQHDYTKMLIDSIPGKGWDKPVFSEMTG